MKLLPRMAAMQRGHAINEPSRSRHRFLVREQFSIETKLAQIMNDHRRIPQRLVTPPTTQQRRFSRSKETAEGNDGRSGHEQNRQSLTH